jgi:hypothetical protein
MTQERVVGHVIGKDTHKGREVWKVRVNGEKIQVASIRDNIVLAPGLSVSFLIGTFKEGEQSVRKAVDVMILSETREELKNKVRPSDYDSISLVVIENEDDDSPYVWFTNHQNEQEALNWSKKVGTMVGFARFDINNFRNEILEFDSAKNGFTAIMAISNIDGVDRALEQLLTVAYELGRKNQ